MPRVAIWGIHAGEDDEARSLFLAHSTLAIGSRTNRCDFTSRTTRQEFRGALRRAYGREELTDPQVSALAAQVFRYAWEIKQGDLVAYAPKSGAPDAGVVHLGRVAGPYQHRPDRSARYPHQRAVTWLKTVARSELPATAQAALWMKRPTVWRITDGAEVFEEYSQRPDHPFNPQA